MFLNLPEGSGPRESAFASAMPPKYTVVQTKIDSNEEWVKIAGDDAEMNFLHDSSRQNSGPASQPQSKQRAKPPRTRRR